MMKSAIVTGAGGFIGGALTKRLLENDYKVYGVDIYINSLQKFNQHNNFVPIAANLEHVKLSEIVNDKVDLFFYIAWGGTLGGSDLYNAALQAKNVETAVCVCEDIIKKCKHYIFCGSSYEYMRNKTKKELPINIYGIAKGAASQICASIAYRNHVKFSKAVLTNTFGYGDKSQKAVNTIIKSMINNVPLKLVEGNNKNDWAYIDDTIDGLLAIEKSKEEFKEYYIGHRNITTFKEKIIDMRDALAPNIKLNFGSMEDDTYVDYALIDLDALYNDTGFECKADFKESILKTAEWLKYNELKNGNNLQIDGGGGTF